MDRIDPDNHNPSFFLPPLSNTSSLSVSIISNAIRRLQDIYTPFYRPSSTTRISRRKSRRLSNSIPDSGYASEAENSDRSYTQEESETQLKEIVRADVFERAYAVRWLTGFISKASMWDAEAGQRENFVDEAAALLACCAQVKESNVALTRHFNFARKYQDGHESTIQIELNDAPLSFDDHTSVGLQSWGSSVVFARMLCANPENFDFIGNNHGQDTFRILELGAGTGLLSIAAAKILHETGRRTAIIATDYHPDVLLNLQRNITDNLSFDIHNPLVTVSVDCYDWQHPHSSAPFDKTYDLILAADVIYHVDHAEWIHNSVQKLLKCPSAESSNGGIFWLLIAVRKSGRHENVDATVEEAFVSASSNDSLSHVGSYRLTILYSQRIGRSEGVGRADEGEYRLFKIAWKR